MNGCKLVAPTKKILCDEKPFAQDKPKPLPFNQTGNLSDTDTGGDNHTGVWRLVYDTDDNANLEVGLTIPSTAKCIQLDQDVPCASILQSGKRARVIGDILGSQVTVKEIQVTF
jgi:hypothetical protein